MSKRRFLIAFALLCLNTLVVIAFVQFSSDFSIMQTTNSLLMYGRKAHIFTFLLIIMSTTVVWIVTNKLYFSLAFHDSIFICFSIANYLKMVDRNEQLLPSDLQFVTRIFSLLRMVPKIWDVGIFLILVLIILVLVFSFRTQANYAFSFGLPRLRYILLVSYLIIGYSFTQANHVDSVSQRVLGYLGDEYMPWGDNETQGPVLRFLNSIDVQTIDKPAQYGMNKMKNVTKFLKREANTINQNRGSSTRGMTVIYVLSESLSNPNRIRQGLVNPNPLPFIDSLSKDKQSVTGTMLSSGYGGGTANMEYMALTSLSITNLVSPSTIAYTTVVPREKHVDSVVDQFSDTLAIHPYGGNFYNRRQAYQKMGIDKYFAPDSAHKIQPQKIRGQSYASDKYTYGQVESKILKSDNKTSQFIQVATMQNHADYKNPYINGKSKINLPSKKIVDKYNYLKNYSDGIAVTDKQTQLFLNKLNSLHRPVSVVFYGDHLPGIYNSSLVEKDANLFHETDYFIWSNKESQVKPIPNSQTRFTSPNYFTALLYKRLDIKVSPFQALLTRLSEDLPATYAYSVGKHNSLHIVDSSGKNISVSKVNRKDKKLLSAYKLIQYDQTLGKNYGRSLGLYSTK